MLDNSFSSFALSLWSAIPLPPQLVLLSFPPLSLPFALPPPFFCRLTSLSLSFFLYLPFPPARASLCFRCRHDTLCLSCLLYPFFSNHPFLFFSQSSAATTRSVYPSPSISLFPLPYVSFFFFLLYLHNSHCLSFLSLFPLSYFTYFSSSSTPQLVLSILSPLFPLSYLTSFLLLPPATTRFVYPFPSIFPFPLSRDFLLPPLFLRRQKSPAASTR